MFNRQAHLALILAMIFWSTSFVVLKYSFALYNPYFIIFGRLAVASIVLLVFIKRTMRKSSPRVRDIPLLILMSLFEPCLYFIFEIFALQNTTSSQAAIITSLLPLLVAISAAIILKESLSRKTVIGFIIAAGGAVSLGHYSNIDSNAPDPSLGNFFEFLAMVCATGYTLIVKKLSQRYNPFFLTTVQSVIGTVFFMPIAYFSAGGFPDKIEPVQSLSMIYMGIFVSVLAYSFFNYGIGAVKAAKGAAYINLIPVFSLFWGWIFLGEFLNSIQAVSCLVIIVGLILSQFWGKKSPVP